MKPCEDAVQCGLVLDLAREQRQAVVPRDQREAIQPILPAFVHHPLDPDVIAVPAGCVQLSIHSDTPPFHWMGRVLPSTLLLNLTAG